MLIEVVENIYYYYYYSYSYYYENKKKNGMSAKMFDTLLSRNLVA